MSVSSKLSFTLDEDEIVPVHENVRDRVIAQQRFERTKAEELVQDVRDERLALEKAQRGGRELRFDDDGDNSPNLGLRFLTFHAREPLEIQAVQQLLMNLRLQALIVPAFWKSPHRLISFLRRSMYLFLWSSFLLCCGPSEFSGDHR